MSIYAYEGPGSLTAVNAMPFSVGDSFNFWVSFDPTNFTDITPGDSVTTTYNAAQAWTMNIHGTELKGDTLRIIVTDGLTDRLRVTINKSDIDWTNNPDFVTNLNTVDINGFKSGDGSILQDASILPAFQAFANGDFATQSLRVTNTAGASTDGLFNIGSVTETPTPGSSALLLLSALVAFVRRDRSGKGLVPSLSL